MGYGGVPCYVLVIYHTIFTTYHLGTIIIIYTMPKW